MAGNTAATETPYSFAGCGHPTNDAVQCVCVCVVSCCHAGRSSLTDLESAGTPDHASDINVDVSAGCLVIDEEGVMSGVAEYRPFYLLVHHDA